jgi:hypothetical protein
MWCSVFSYSRVHIINIGDVMPSNAICCYLVVLLELADFYVFSIKKWYAIRYRNKELHSWTNYIDHKHSNALYSPLIIATLHL